jgi:hypothetical protein
VKLRVVGAPSSVFLSALDPVEGGCSEVDSAAIGGSSVGNSLTCSPSRDTPVIAEYVLNKRVAFLQLTAGVDDRSQSPSPILVRVLVDGRVAAERKVPFGQAAALKVPVNGALRLRIEVTAPDLPAECCPTSPTAILGDARLVGAADAIDALVQESTP